MPDDPATPEVSGRISEYSIHYQWYDIFGIRLWADVARHDDPKTLKAMLEEWCALRWGRAPHAPGYTNATERQDLGNIRSIACHLLEQLDCEAVEVIDLKAGVGSVEYQRWNQ